MKSTVSPARIEHAKAIRKHVLIGIATGELLKNIATQLNLSEKTISYHKKRLCSELGIYSHNTITRTVQLTKYAIVNGFVT